MSNPSQFSLIALLVRIFQHMGQQKGASVTSQSHVVISLFSLLQGKQISLLNQHVVFCVCPPLRLVKKLTDFHETCCDQYDPKLYFFYSTNKNMADLRPWKAESP